MKLRLPKAGSGVQTAAGLRSEQALVAAWRRGDVDGFGQLVKQGQDTVIAVAYRITRDQHMAADVMQEAYLFAWGHPEKYEARNNASFTSWICGIAKNMAIRKIGRTRAEMTLWVFDCADPSPGPPKEAELTELKMMLADAVKVLPDDQHRAWMLRENRHKYQEISNIMSKPINTVKWLIAEARNKLQDALRKAGAHI